MKNIVLKFCTFIVKIKYPDLEYQYKYFIRDNYFSRINQIRFFFKDYISKKEYKIIDYKGEFQHEIALCLPFAYWHYLNGTLKKTISSVGTKELYFFSENHQEKYTERDWKANYDNYDFPNVTHSITKNYKKWAMVPFKENYKNSYFIYNKPILVISNKYNTEWDKSPVNFLSILTLDKIIKTYQHKYQIIYNRPLSSLIVDDNSEVWDLNEYQWLKTEYPDVILLNELYKENHNIQINNFNHLQLLVYANCDHFISVHGGNSALASYFGGTNIVFSTGWMEALFNEYDTFWPRFSNAKILHAKTTNEIFEYLKTYY